MAELKNIDDYLKGDVDLTKVDYLVVESGDANFFQVSGGAHFFGVDGSNQSIYKLWLDNSGKLVSEDASGHKDVVAYVDDTKIQFVYGRHTDPYNGLTQPVTIPLQDGSNAQKELLVAFKGFASTWFNNLYVPRVSEISIDVVTSDPNPSPENVLMSSFSLSQNALSGKVGETGKITISGILPENTTDKTFKFSIEDTSIVTSTTDGLDYNFSYLKSGTTKAHWVSNDGNAKADIVITVSPATVSVSGVTLDKVSNSIEVGESATAIATVSPANASNKNVTWDSSDKSSVTVDANGKYTGVKAGTSNVTSTTVDGNKVATVAVTVTDSTQG